MKTYTVIAVYEGGTEFEWFGSTYATLEEAARCLFEEALLRRRSGNKLINECGCEYSLIIRETEREDGWTSDW